MSSRLVKGMYKSALLLIYFANVYSVIDGSTVAVVGALAAAIIGSIQHYGHKASKAEEGLHSHLLEVQKNLGSKVFKIEEDMKKMSEDIFTKQDLINLGEEIGNRIPA